LNDILVIFTLRWRRTAAFGPVEFLQSPFSNSSPNEFQSCTCTARDCSASTGTLRTWLSTLKRLYYYRSSTIFVERPKASLVLKNCHAHPTTTRTVLLCNYGHFRVAYYYQFWADTSVITIVVQTDFPIGLIPPVFFIW